MAWDSRARRAGDDLPAARLLRVRAAVPVLLDGDHRRSNRTPSSTTTRTTTRSGSRSRRSTTSSKLLFETDYPRWLLTTMAVAVGATVLSLFCQRARRLCHPAAALQGQPVCRPRASISAYLVPPSILFIPLATMVFKLGLFDTPLALILTYPTFLVPFCTWLLIGYFKSIPYELEECALIDGATRLQILRQITLPLAVPGPDLAPASSPSRCPGTSSSMRWPSSRAARRRPCRSRS